MAGGVVRRANAVNSRDTHAGTIERTMAPGVASAPGSPNRWGRYTVCPRSTTRRAKPATAGVMPGISAITMTAVPSPRRYTVRSVPPKLKVVVVKSSRESRAMAFDASALAPCAPGWRRAELRSW